MSSGCMRIIAPGLRSDGGVGPRRRAPIHPALHLPVGLLCLHALIACGGSGNDSASDNDSTPGAQNAGTVFDGRYVGTITVDGTAYFADALLAKNSEARLYMGGPYANDGSIQRSRDGGSLDFFWRMDWDTGDGRGSLMGRHSDDCGPAHSPSSRFCHRSMSNSVHIEQIPGSQTGEIRGTIFVETETWALEMTPWYTQYNVPARLQDLSGTYIEELTGFGYGMMALTIDAAGRVFFQSPAGSCVGSGVAAPREDGTNVFDISFTMELCDYPYHLLNGKFFGLATLSASSYTDHDSHLRVWSSNGQSGVTMWGQRP